MKKTTKKLVRTSHRAMPYNCWQVVFEPVKDNLPKVISLYDPAEGSGGMLTEGFEYLTSLGISPKAIQLYGTKINPETYAITLACRKRGGHLGA